MVRYEGRKMSKSLGNLVLVGQALERAPAAAVRLYLVSHRYGRDWDFRWSGLERMVRFVERLRALLEGEVRGAGAPHRGTAAGAGPGARALPAKFVAALADDLNTPEALRVLQAAVRERDAAGARQMLPILAGTASLHRP
jgi:cysteinyl-tRNA synthetase